MNGGGARTVWKRKRDRDKPRVDRIQCGSVASSGMGNSSSERENKRQRSPDHSTTLIPTKNSHLCNRQDHPSPLCHLPPVQHLISR